MLLRYATASDFRQTRGISCCCVPGSFRISDTDQQRATQAALKRKPREKSSGIKPTQSLHQAAANGDIDGVKA
ncbi:MAG: hypothetical protein ACYSUD_09395, partial [Planctomycetota bacterium]